MKIFIFDYSKLKGKIREVCGTYSEFAHQLGCSLNTLSAKLNNKNEFTQSDIFKSIRILHISLEDIPKYFFVLRVIKN